jgi:hypothetical protein
LVKTVKNPIVPPWLSHSNAQTNHGITTVLNFQTRFQEYYQEEKRFSGVSIQLEHSTMTLYAAEQLPHGRKERVRVHTKRLPKISCVKVLERSIAAQL